MTVFEIWFLCGIGIITFIAVTGLLSLIVLMLRDFIRWRRDKRRGGKK